MDFTCTGCGKYHWIPPTDEERRLAIENLEFVIDTFMREPWQVEWLNYHEPELMRRFYAAIEKMVKK